MTTRVRRTIAWTMVAFLFLSVWSIGAPGAMAAENEGWAVWPTTPPGGEERFQFIVDLKPGTEIEDSVSVTNKTNGAKTFRLYASDAYNTEVGSFSLRLDEEPKEEIGAWVTLSTNEVTVDPGASVDVPFSMAVPGDATPGDHAGGIVVVDTEPSENVDGDLELDVLQAVGVRIYGRVDGPLQEAAEITVLELDTHTKNTTLLGGSYDATVAYTITNTGNVRIVPTTAGKLKGPVSTKADIPANELPELLPGGSATVVEQFSGLRPTGPLTAELSVTAPGIDEETREVTTWVVPWLLLLVLAILIGGLIVWRRRRGRSVADPEVPDEKVLVDA